MAILLTLLCLTTLLFVRNEITLRLTLRRIHEIHKYNEERITAGSWAESDLLRYDEVPDYDVMLIDLRKWTYRQFFPEEVS